MINKVVNKVVNERIENPESAKEKHDFLTLMLEAEDKETGAKLSSEQICDNARLFLIAGHETTAKTLASMLWLIAQNPNVSRKIIEEVDRMNVDGSEPKLSDVEQYTYLENVVLEAMRIYPIAPATGRDAQVDTELGGKFIPKGTPVMVPLYAVHHNPKYWGEDCDMFKPERWEQDTEEFKFAKRYCYVPFGGGRHKCIGYKFALEELKLALIRLYRKFEFEADKSSPKTLKIVALAATIGFPDGCPVVIKKRSVRK